MKSITKLVKRILLFIIVATGVCGCVDNMDKDVPYVFVGDSIIARWPLDETFPSQLVYNYGKSGAGISYLEGLQGRFNGTDVVVLIGSNNNPFFNEEGMDKYVEQYFRYVTGLTDKTIYLYPVLPRKFSNDPEDVNVRIAAFNTKIKESLTAYPQIVYLDVFNDFMKDGHINYQCYSDGLHLNDYGYEILTSYLLKEIE